VHAGQERSQGQQQTLTDQNKRIEMQQESINQLVRYILSASIFRHLCGVAVLKEYAYRHALPMSREMYFLRDIGFIQPRAGRTGFLDFNESLNYQNLAELVEPTPIGWSCIRFRKEEIPKDWFEGANRQNVRTDGIAALASNS
jgi:hypothetical protein